MESQVETIGRAFVDHYYQLFDNDRASLSSVYQPTSMLTFEGQKFQGIEQITSKLVNLQFGECKHDISTVDCQPSLFSNDGSGSIVVCVSGGVYLAGEDHQLRFNQMFHLVRAAASPGIFYVQNDIFRLNYG